MGAFLAIHDPDDDRRRRFLERAAADVAPLADLPRESVSSGPVAALWATRLPAMVDSFADAEGIALLAGEALADPDGTRVTARSLRARWRGPERTTPEAFDGYHAGVVLGTDGSAALGADLLGLYPLYYAALGDVLLVGSSPEPFRHHPSFRAALDPVGLTGILLTNGLVGGRTLWQGVRRVGAGQILVRRPDGSVREVLQYSLPCSDLHFGRSFEEQVAVADEVIRDALRRLSPPGRPHGILLSGGLDSRLLAGYLSRQGTPLVALTQGREGDIELACARGVAESLGLEHRVVEVDDARLPEFAVRHAKWDHLASGFQVITRWDVAGRVSSPRARWAATSWIRSWGRSSPW